LSDLSEHQPDGETAVRRYAKDCKCIECGEQATAFFPVVDPDIPAHPYCKKHLSEARARLLMRLHKAAKDKAKEIKK
jgi:hypothetical protein